MLEMAKNSVASANSRPGQSLFRVPVSLGFPSCAASKSHLRPCPKTKLLGSATSGDSCSGFKKRSGRKISESSQFRVFLLIDLTTEIQVSKHQKLNAEQYSPYVGYHCGISRNVIASVFIMRVRGLVRYTWACVWRQRDSRSLSVDVTQSYRRIPSDIEVSTV